MNDVSTPLFPDWLNVSRETFGRLLWLEAEVKKWNKAINLIGRSSVEDMWKRHVLDSAQIFELLPNDSRRWADLGSGGGFPGLVIAVLALERAQKLETILVESDGRKAVFLRHVVQELALRATVRSDRIEDTPTIGADVVSARALASLGTLCWMAFRHLGPNGVALFQKGASYGAELKDCSESWSFDLKIRPSRTDENAVILEVGGLMHV